jgi:hypothetical protein
MRLRPKSVRCAGNTALGDWATGDANHDCQITVDEVLTAVNNALNGACKGREG